MEAITLALTLKDIIQFLLFAGAAAGGIWKVSNILNEIRTEIRLLSSKFDSGHTQILDHEARLRIVENQCAGCKKRDLE